MAETSKASAIDFDISRWISFDRGLLLINGWEVYSLKSICQHTIKEGGASSPPSKVNSNENLFTYFGLPRCDRQLARADLATFLPRLSEDYTRALPGNHPGCGARPLRWFCRSAKCPRQTLLLELKSCHLETPSHPEQ